MFVPIYDPNMLNPPVTVLRLNAQFQLVCYLGKKFENSTFKILGDMARTREALRTDGRTDIHGTKTYVCLPQGETYNYIF